MKVRPILFSGPMVRALLEGRKTQTRRILKLPDKNAESRRGPWERSTVGGRGVMTGDGKPFPERACLWHPKAGTIVVPSWSVGDLLWVKESWRANVGLDALSPTEIAEKCLEAGYRRPWAPIRYAADGCPINWDRGEEPGRNRAAIHMPRWASRLTLQVTDVRVQRLHDIDDFDAAREGVSERADFSRLWNSINGDGAWNANPWVAALTVTAHRVNVDELLKQREAA